VHFLAGHGAQDGLPGHDWAALTRSGGTIVVYMGGATLSGLAAHFIEAGMRPEMPAVAVENASLAKRQMFRATLATLPGLVQAQNLDGPVVVLIGEALAEAAAAEAMLAQVAEPAWQR
jgi:siroheme synthase